MLSCLSEGASFHFAEKRCQTQSANVQKTNKQKTKQMNKQTNKKPFPKNKNPKNLLKTFRKTRELLLFNQLQDNLAHSETGGAQ